MPGLVVSVLHTHPHPTDSDLVAHVLFLFYKRGSQCSTSEQDFQGPVAGTQHSQDLRPGLSDAEECVYKKCTHLTLL